MCSNNLIIRLSKLKQYIKRWIDLKFINPSKITQKWKGVID